MEPTSSKEYRIAPDLRRCCWYAMVGAAFAAALFYWVARHIQNRDTEEIVIGCGLCALAAAGTALPLQWKLRLDEHGLARYRFFRWDYWSWADLATGRIEKRHCYTLYDPDRPWWRRKLHLEHLAGGDIEEVIAEINTYYQLPAPPDVPAAVTISYDFHRKATFDADGIHLAAGKKTQVYSWSELREIHIVRMDPVRRDFKSLVITLPDQEVELKMVSHQGGRSPSWRGAKAEELNEFFLQTVPAERIHVSIEGKPLTKREHIEKKLRHAEKMRREMSVMVAVFSLLFVGCLVFIAIVDGVFKAVLLTVMIVIPFTPFGFILRDYTKQIEDLRNRLKSVSDAAD